MSKFHSNGKLLLTGEYVVLDGALALALPTKLGQWLEVTPSEERMSSWTALDKDGNLWFEVKFKLEESEFTSSDIQSSHIPEKRLLKILAAAHELNSQIFASKRTYNITTRLEFDQNWGLGSSSTLINNISQWFEIDPYKLLEKSFGGSGYDVAAAQAAQPITYQLQENDRSILNVDFNPPFKEELFFVYLNKKQNSRSSIAHYRQQEKESLNQAVDKISALTANFLTCENLTEFNLLIEIHETLISQLINTPKIKSQLFSDYNGSIKSLGGWGGDFILATGGETEKNYFREKGYEVIIPYSDLIL